MFLSRKKLILILFILLIIVFIFMYNDNNSNNSNDFKETKIVETNGTPVSSRTIILDAGHGQPDRWSRIK